MTYHTTEQEQLEQFKHWLKAYGLPVFVGLVVGVVFLYAWQYYQGRQLAKLEAASQRYDVMLTEYLHYHMAEARQEAEGLKTTAPNTIYAMLARLLLVKLAVSDNKLLEAQQQLQWLIEHAQQADIKQISRIRLARLLIAQQQAEQALQILMTIDHIAFMPIIYELRGDAYRDLHKLSEAKLAYKSALESMRSTNALEINPLLQFKFDALP